jgi:hypothetical protein
MSPTVKSMACKETHTSANINHNIKRLNITIPFIILPMKELMIESIDVIEG